MMYERSLKPYKDKEPIREILPFPEGSISLSKVYCKKNPDYTHQSFHLLKEISTKEMYAALFKYLKNRPRSQWECETKLKDLEYLPEEIQAGIDYFISQNWINDKIFALFLIEGSQTYRPVGNFSLKQKLKNKHISKEIIDIALEQYLEENSLINDGIKLIKTQLYRFNKYEGYKKEEKIKEYLYRRGFSSDDIRLIIKEF